MLGFGSRWFCLLSVRLDCEQARSFGRLASLSNHIGLNELEALIVLCVVHLEDSPLVYVSFFCYGLFLNGFNRDSNHIGPNELEALIVLCVVHLEDSLLVYVSFFCYGLFLNGFNRDSPE